MKHFWNLAREKNVTQLQRDTLIGSIVTKMKGNILQVTLRHDASRAVQCILQFGTIPQRWQILNEMSERLSEVIYIYIYLYLTPDQSN
jgi:pumilio homology domain family member 6